MPKPSLMLPRFLALLTIYPKYIYVGEYYTKKLGYFISLSILMSLL